LSPIGGAPGDSTRVAIRLGAASYATLPRRSLSGGRPFLPFDREVLRDLMSHVTRREKAPVSWAGLEAETEGLAKAWVNLHGDAR
jgi:hypothetical protein